MDLVVPAPLAPSDTIRVVAPSRSLALISEPVRRAATDRLTGLGLRVTFGEHVLESGAFVSASVASRVADLHAAFADPEVRGILTVIGGYNSNELLPHLDWELIRANPKVFCGYSDISALQNAMLARAGLVTWSGPHYSSFGMRDHFELTRKWFHNAVFGDAPLVLQPAPQWTDDAWFLDQDRREVLPNDGWWRLRPGTGAGQLIGGNLTTVNRLPGTGFMPVPDRPVVLFVEDDEESAPHTFAPDLASLLQCIGAANVAALVFGRFQRATGMTRDLLQQILDRQP
ncbi:MAG: LD-carboxypeptidase, partial [Micromonosporaceae bacterium]|nr:LD-carboxypeptidase [Micromonosporaceae bacterium]